MPEDRGEARLQGLKRPADCAHCGHHNGDWESRCQKCGRPLTARGPQRTPAPATAATVTTAAVPQPAVRKPRPPAFPEHLRQHLQDRVQHYRARQEDRSLPLPFDEPEPPPKVISFPPPALPVEEEMRVPRSRPPREPRANEPAAPQSPQAALEFHPVLFEEEGWKLRPVAPLQLRMSGHMKDLGWMAVAAGCFAAPLPILAYAGPYAGDYFSRVAVVPGLLLLGGVLCGSLLLALLFGLLFYSITGATPGMQAAGLRLVNFDGKPPTRPQRLWRVLGAVVSAGSFLIGFLWAAVDEEKLYWHDHISKTFLTLADS